MLPVLRISFEAIISSLPFLNRHQLIDVVNESNRLLSLACAIVTASIPVEVWKIIVDKELMRLRKEEKDDFDTQNLNQQSTLQCIGCVSRSWSVICRDLARRYFDVCNPYSNWVMNQFDDMTELWLYQSRPKNFQEKTLLKLTNLRSLSIHNPTIPFTLLSQLTNLTHLGINNPHILDADVGSLTGLVGLALEKKASISNEGVKNLTNLTKLRIHRNDILPDEVFFYLSNLKELNLFLNRSITDNAAKYLTNLQNLCIKCRSDSPQTNEFLKYLTNLTYLELNDDKFNDDAISGLTKLNTLIVDDISSLTEISLTKLTNLTYLSSSPNWIVTDAILSHLTNLTDLDLDADNKFVSDNSISRLTNLKYLSILDNHLISDKSISQLTQLVTLCISEPHLITEKSITQLPNLSKIIVPDNMDDISEFEESMRKLTYLSIIYFS